ncbi:hypothetical protein VIAG107301_21285 [Vibrio agarivorans]
MDDAKLNMCLREDGVDRIGKTLQAIDTSDKNIFNATLIEFG